MQTTQRLKLFFSPSIWTFMNNTLKLVLYVAPLFMTDLNRKPVTSSRSSTAQKICFPNCFPSLRQMNHNECFT